MTNSEGGSPFDLEGLLQQAQAMQQQLVDAQAKAATMSVEGIAGGGVVRVRVTGGGEFTKVSIDPSVIDPDDASMLEDLVLAALHDASHKVQNLHQQALGGLGNIGGLDGLLGGR